jgi:hypothetical protein
MRRRESNMTKTKQPARCNLLEDPHYRILVEAISELIRDYKMGCKGKGKGKKR